MQPKERWTSKDWRVPFPQQAVAKGEVPMKYKVARQRMVEEQLLGRQLFSPEVIKAFERVPRELFIPPEFRHLAYKDRALPIGEGQTISQPYVVALMTEALGIPKRAKVLDIGTGSGYQAAILAEMGAQVITIERQGVLARGASLRLEALGYDEIEVVAGDGSLGWLPEAPYDGILVAASGPRIPTALLQQLKVDRRLVMPLAIGSVEQVLVQITSKGRGRYSRRDFGSVLFVPLIGEEGWDSDGRQRWW